MSLLFYFFPFWVNVSLWKGWCMKKKKKIFFLYLIIFFCRFWILKLSKITKLSLYLPRFPCACFSCLLSHEINKYINKSQPENNLFYNFLEKRKNKQLLLPNFYCLFLLFLVRLFQILIRRLFKTFKQPFIIHI